MGKTEPSQVFGCGGARSSEPGASLLRRREQSRPLPPHPEAGSWLPHLLAARLLEFGHRVAGAAPCPARLPGQVRRGCQANIMRATKKRPLRPFLLNDAHHRRLVFQARKPQQDVAIDKHKLQLASEVRQGHVGHNRSCAQAPRSSH